MTASYSVETGPKQATRQHFGDAVKSCIAIPEPTILSLPGATMVDFRHMLKNKITKGNKIICIEKYRDEYTKILKYLATHNIEQPRRVWHNSLHEFIPLSLDRGETFDAAALDFTGDSIGELWGDAATFVTECTSNNFVVSMTFNANMQMQSKSKFAEVHARHLKNNPSTFCDYGTFDMGDGLRGSVQGYATDGKTVTPNGRKPKRANTVFGEMYGNSTDPTHLAHEMITEIHKKDKQSKRKGYLTIRHIPVMTMPYQARKNSAWMNFFILHGTRT